MSTLIRSAEAAAILGVSKPTLYAYVSRGRLARATAADGRTSLFARDEVQRLAERSRRAPSGPRATIDVQISSGVTVIDEHALSYRGADAVELAQTRTFEDVAEFLWSGVDRSAPATVWPRVDRPTSAALAPIDGLSVSPIGRMATAAHVLAALHADDIPSDAARRLLVAVPAVLGSTHRTGPYARRLAGAWKRRPSEQLVAALDSALILLADHELATSTLAVRIGASVRTSAYAGFAAGLATIDGLLHGSASAEVSRFLAACSASEPSAVIAQLRASRAPIPGFGHKVYRGVDPRYGLLADHVRRLDPSEADLLDAVVAEAGRAIAHQPNVDLALGALTRAAHLGADTPIFAVARIAGWAAHFAEELDERPLRFRGVATPVR
ncbi:MAG TPA: citrate synthase [Ilumatobacteraceae bacterium]|nr:citrate synthase [Ilumatobacteraceae bacterium]